MGVAKSPGLANGRIMTRFAFLLVWGFLSAPASAQTNAEGDVDPLQCAPEGLAVGGYDLVSYHRDTGPVKGDATIATSHQGLTYHFASTANRAEFVANPGPFLPTYRGFCAATLAMGRLACPDYTNYKIEDGRLLLFELAGFTNGRTVWNSDPLGFRQRADGNYQRLLVPHL